MSRHVRLRLEGTPGIVVLSSSLGVRVPDTSRRSGVVTAGVESVLSMFLTLISFTMRSVPRRFSAARLLENL